MTRRRRHAPLLLLATIACTWPGVAHAGTVAVQAERLVVLAAPGEANDIVIAQDGDRFVVSDAGVTPVAGDATCTTAESAPVVVCPSAGIAALTIDAGDGNDRVDVQVALPATLDGGPGDDELYGGAGDDVLSGGAGADVQVGRAGSDVVRYDDGLHDGGVAVALSGGDGDGSPGEGDDVREVEIVEGTPGHDHVLGTDAAETFHGGSGDDIAELLGGADVFRGGEGSDSCMLDASDDVCDGGPGTADLAVYRTSVPLRIILDGIANDGPAGGAGNVFAVEQVVGGEGPDVIVGGAADEELSGRGGNDVVLGGPGDDVVAGDRGADVLGGGDGRDQVNYSSIFVAAPVRVTIDGAAGDGAPGEDDHVGTDIEVIEGTTTAADVLAAGRRGTELRGLGGDDRLSGGPAADVLDAGPGDDSISALDGVRDRVACGPGADAVVADAIDQLEDCETRLREAPRYAIRRAVQIRPTVTLVFTCPRAFRSPLAPRRARCRGRTALRLGVTRTLAQARFDVPAGHRRRVRFRVPLRERRRLSGTVAGRLVTTLPGVPRSAVTSRVRLRR